MAKLHLIGNAHLDPVWLWRWQEGFSEIISTFRSALDRMNDFPDFKFTSACASYYQWIEEIDPEMFEEIRQRVKEGRWNIVGGWFLQPDCNIPSGESFARHGLISQRYFQEKFGVMAKTGYNVDSFGHNASIPQILCKSGMENYVFMRPMPYEKPELQDDLFLWESPDGSRVCTYRIPWFYNFDTVRLKFADLKAKADAEQMDYMAFYGVGNHGGGPTIRLLDTINKLGIEDMEYSTPDIYFDAVDKDQLNVVCDELQHHARGCYSASSFVKQMNRKCENNLLAAEKFAVMAKHLVGSVYPGKKLQEAWKKLLFHQFHDILDGCSIKKAYEDAGHAFGEVMSVTEYTIFAAMEKIARNIDTLQGETLPAYKQPEHWQLWEHEVLGTPVVVFNPHAWSVRMPVQIYADVKKIVDPVGNEVPFQKVRGDQTNGDGDKYNIAFTAEVDALGYAVYRVFTEKESTASFAQELKVTERSLENDCIRVEFDAQTGDICRFYDKKTGKLLIDQPCKAVLLDETDCDTWAHNKEYLGETIGMFDTPVFKIIESGAVRAALRVETRYGGSVLRRDYTIIPGSSEVKVKVKVDFHEKHKVLKFAFPVQDDKVIAKIPYGTIERPFGTGEEPCGSWFASGGICVANDAKYGYDTLGDEVRLTVLRGAIYADHYGVRDEFCEYMEQGIHEFSYSVFPFNDRAAAERKAEELNFPLRFLMDSFHNGKLPEKISCLENDCESVIVSAVKEYVDGDNTVLRVYEMNGEDTTASVKLFDKQLEFAVSHHEIKTVDDSGKVLDLLEREE